MQQQPPPPASTGRRAGHPGDGPPLGWRERLGALRFVPGLVRLVWEAHRGYTLAMAVLRLARGVIPIGALWVGKLIIDRVVAAQQGHADWHAVLPLVLVEIAIVLVGELLSRGSMAVEGVLSDLFAIRSSTRLMEHAATLDLAQFEDPAFYDHLERARRQASGRLSLLTNLLSVVQSLVTLVALSVALLTFSPWLVLLLAVTILPGFLAETKFAAQQYALAFQWTQRRRELEYLLYAGASDMSAKEVQLFGLAPWLVARYRRLATLWHGENRRLAIRRAAVGGLLAFVSTAGYYGAYLLIIARTVSGTITLGSLTFLAAAFARGRDLIQQMLATASAIFDESLYLRDLFAFFEMRPGIASRPGALPVPQPLREGFVFEDVGFRYPGSDVWAVRHLSFRIRPGERVALVGENGAGKTTLTRLLTRLYDPSEGRVLLDGVDLRDYDLASLRSAISAIFQDFVRYDLRFDENIGVGSIETTRAYLDAERPPPSATASVAETDAMVPAVIRQAAERSMAATLLPGLAGRWGQMLGRRFDGGIGLSGGEWQKVALARAQARDAQVLILDEPTAALDARAEREVSRGIAALMDGRTVLLISHRFSTVRMADQILVLKYGELIEAGSHEVLVARGGLYAELFAMQAQGFR